MHRRSTVRAQALLLPVVVIAALLPAGGSAATVAEITVEPGETRLVPRTVRLDSLSVAPGGTVAPPAGRSLTLTVDGVETGSVLAAAEGTVTTIAPGAYRGDVRLSVADANLVAHRGDVFPLRQGLYVDATGLVPAKSALASVEGGRVEGRRASDVRISSTGEAFAGVFAKDGAYTLDKPRIAFAGNGRSDFVGDGAGIVATGPGTRLVVDGADISTTGVVRSGVIAADGSDVVVKNSRIRTGDGVLPADYRSTVDLDHMRDAPWMLGISGNNRATNLLGTGTRAAYLNSSLSSQGWGVLSTERGRNCRLTVVNSTVANTGPDGYGSYATDDVAERFLGTRFAVGTYATIIRGGAIHYGDSTPEAVARLNAELGLGLTAPELAALPTRNTVVESRRFGVMWHGAGSVEITGGTVFDTGEATFLNKGQQAAIAVDGSRGARLNPANGVVLQLMDDDDPGPVEEDGRLLNTGVYREPAGDPVKLAGFDVTEVHSTDATATFSDIALKGHFYNAIRGGAVPGEGKNLVLAFDNSDIDGVLSASAARHAVSTITATEYRQLGTITNTVGPVVNNGVIVQLRNGSRWVVAGTSHLSELAIDADAAVTAHPGHTVTMTVDGVPTAIASGRTYTGSITLAVHQAAAPPHSG
ncbi:hypothetical protein ABZ816_24445 [Actinosynnema sp. NPDC047251]|uniref:Putative secreted protein n=1 Tax=Saccharothrix espanaensis (strain ATCC 51144 / DSM 44229 / JCM 9112 / NBRC 15066 / NRRL 15764) TaxID=1179773 RepID=K0K442_SACES|nr:hypothetical protein [Saccharothrix espanaensis]CCH32372.1 putative secreted protein [Saccharothrix espanaensis DSM 44229]